ncbi:glutamate-5-semialdehyde dehydrogenase [Streptococcus danieliae]|uniref:Gamma-glutamyl phosphate reductase n=1 Tax=Streptococcus danieliae TaxID=747656 RepID=A0A7Z0M5H8_9STRE|nr:glutamate-5-semialdehyde dehydrogenase [Streptococcus danieliae]MBF0698996.1 glutamate-5-semialdehyde dehydrogenase [Streptococcus danieliae]NYS96173.1 glutamate-5-semialdehyde dehydrogenase [Streptococcus danieliae]
MTSTQELLDSLLEHKASINVASSQVKNQALAAMADQLEAQADAILAGNALDMAAAQGKISPVMQDRLLLTRERIADMAAGIRALLDLPDPVGLVLEERVREDGLQIQKRSIPFGLIGMIYESRPNVTSDAAALAIKSGNAVILRGGKEAFNSAQAIVKALKTGLEQAGVHPGVLELVQDTSRASAQELMTAKGKIDLLVPRGGAGLIQAVVEQATVPVIETGTGLCHVYIDQQVDLEMAVALAVNAKTSRPSVCNAAEVLLVHQDIAADFLPAFEAALADKVELRADASAQPYLQAAIPAGSQDFDTEFLDYIMAVKVLPSLEAAISHINHHSSGHSEAIVTTDTQAADLFTLLVDSAAVYVNASTRFTDGGEFGLGCELGISTQKMHARGPMGLQEMTTYKYVIKGQGQTR